jgi:hypothetical protein
MSITARVRNTKWNRSLKQVVMPLREWFSDRLTPKHGKAVLAMLQPVPKTAIGTRQS